MHSIWTLSCTEERIMWGFLYLIKVEAQGGDKNNLYVLMHHEKEEDWGEAKLKAEQERRCSCD